MTPTPLSTPFIPSSAAQDKMDTVLAAWARAPSGPKRAAALKHYHAAQKANAVKDHSVCYKELDAAMRALA